MEFLNSFDTTILYSLYVSLAFILVDTIFGVLLSIKNKTFNISDLPKFISTAVLPYIGGLVILAIFANYLKDFVSVFIIMTGLVDLKFGKECLMDKVKELFK